MSDRLLDQVSKKLECDPAHLDGLVQLVRNTVASNALVAESAEYLAENVLRIARDGGMESDVIVLESIGRLITDVAQRMRMSQQRTARRD